MSWQGLSVGTKSPHRSMTSPKPHSSGILSLSDPLVTFQADVQRGEAWTYDSQPLAVPVPSSSHLCDHRFGDGVWLALPQGSLCLLDLTPPQSTSLKLKFWMGSGERTID